VSAHPIVREDAESRPSASLGLNPGLPVLVNDRAGRATTRRDERLLGAVGLAVIIAILGLAVYFGLRYLL
jgi:hypothetical protein